MSLPPPLLPESLAHGDGGARLLVVCSLFPPDALGGAEMSASNLAHWLHKNGVKIAVLTTAKSPDEVCEGKEENGLKIWRVWMPRLYPKYYFARARFWQKPIWHFQDHFDPRNRRIMAKVLDAFKPDHVNIHIIQGLGYNGLAEIARRRIPTTYFLHDLSLACIRMSMFRKGKECARQCVLCKFSSAYKARLVAQVPRLGFCSPSRANLEKLARYFPVKKRLNTSIINANKYPPATVARTESAVFRILYVGRLHVSKGVHLLLAAAAALAGRYPLTVTIAGSGPDEAALRAEYGAAPWCRFTGFIAHEEISNIMMESDVLCIPSIWAEPLGGVVIHALTLGLPAIGSDRGGIPEMIEHGKNGLLFNPDNEGELQAVLEKIAAQRSLLKGWRDYALANAYKFDQDYLGQKILDFIAKI